MTLPWMRSTGDPCNRRYTQARCVPSVYLEQFDPSSYLDSEDTLRWRGRDGVIELSDGRLVVLIRGHVFCIRSNELDWVIPRKRLANGLNAGIEDPEDRVNPEYASAPTLLPGGELCVIMQGGVAAISVRGDLIGTARVDLVDDTGDSPNFDKNGNALITTIGGALLRWSATTAAPEEVRSGLGYDLVCPAVLPDGRLLVSAYCDAGLCLLDRTGYTIWEGVLESADLVPTFSHRGLCLAGTINGNSSVAVTTDGVAVWTFPEAARFASHPSGLLVAASVSALTALDDCGKTHWSFRLPDSESLPLGHFVCEDSNVVCATRHKCFAVAPPGKLLWSLELEAITSAPIPLSTGGIALVADGKLVVVTPAT